MSALDEIRDKDFSKRDSIERAIVELWEETNGCEWMAEDAAEKLADLRAENERLKNIETVATDVNEWLIINNLGGVAHQRALAAALAGDA